MTKDGVTNRYKYNELNQLTSSVENKDGKETSNKTYTYDANGNQTKEKDSVTNITVENTYDVDNRLSTSITVNGTKEVVNQENLYNGNGKRIQKKEGHNVVNYFYQDGVVLYTSDKDGNKTSQNFLGIDGNVIGTTRYSSEGFEYYTYNKDVQGSTTSVVGKDGISPVAYDYDDFGVTTTIGDSNFFNEVCYTGGIYDVSTGLYYLNSRYYDPNNGRFITQDTYRGEINNPSTLHLYTYCHNNPINYIDPSGHAVTTGGIEISASAGYSFSGSIFIAKDSKSNIALCASISAGFDIGGIPSAGITWVTAYYPYMNSVDQLGGFGFTGGAEMAIGKFSYGGGITVGMGSTSKNVLSPYVSRSKPINYLPKGLAKYNAKCIGKFGNMKVRFKMSAKVGYTSIILRSNLKSIGKSTINKTHRKLFMSIKEVQKKNRNYVEYKLLSKSAKVYKNGKVVIKS